MERQLTVSQLNNMLKDIIDNQIVLESISLIGEISSFSITRGIAYFVLKDDLSMINCVMFNASSSYNIGDKVVVSGSVKYYVKTGKLSFNAYKIEQYGQGALYQQFLMMKEKLSKEGLFDAEHKKTIPKFAKRVGIITSKTGAVIQDIINVTTRRNPTIDLVLKDVQVQGVYAKDQIVEAINFFSNYEDIDLIVVARGGGSLEDLQPFNEEEVARACFNCKKPIISAVGHETDYTIIDFVADLRAPTPSAGAELFAWNLEDIKNSIEYYQEKYQKIIEKEIIESNLKLNSLVGIMQSNIKDVVSLVEKKVDGFLTNYLVSVKNYVFNLEKSLQVLLTQIDHSSPSKILSKGYAVLTYNDLPIKHFSKLKKDDIIKIQTNKYNITSSVVDVKEKL